MNNIIDFLTSSSITLIAVFTPVIVAVVAVFKNWIENTKWYPIIAVVAGILLAVFFSGLALSWAILLGVLAGLSASGLYSGVKTINE